MTWTAGLDAIAWSTLEAAFGDAAEVPRLIRGLASRSRNERRTAFEQLDNALQHQGAVFCTAAEAAIPFLVRAALDPAVEDRDLVLRLLADLAVGDHANHLAGGYDPAASALATLIGLDNPQLARIEPHAKRFLSLLDDADERVRSAAALLLAFLPRAAASALVRARARHARERSATVRASLHLACALTGRRFGARPDILPRARGDSAVERTCATIARMWLGDTITEVDVATLLAACERDQKVVGLPWARGDLGFVVRQVLAGALGRLPGDRLLAILRAHAASQGSHEIAEAALAAAFPEDRAPRTERRTLQELTASQRALLTALGELEVFPFALVHHGFPDHAWGLGRLLGGDGPDRGPIDALGPDGVPLWKWFRDVLDGRRPAAALAAELDRHTSHDVAEICRDALGSYGLWLAWPDGYWILRVLSPLVFELARSRVDDAEAIAWAERLLARGTPKRQFLECALLVRLLSRSGPMPARFDALLAPALEDWGDPAGLRAALAQLPHDRLEAAILANDGFPLEDEDPLGNRYHRVLWLYIDLAPTPAVIDRVFQQIDEFPDETRSDAIATDVLCAFGTRITHRLAARARGTSPASRIYARALERVSRNTAD